MIRTKVFKLKVSPAHEVRLEEIFKSEVLCWNLFLLHAEEEKAKTGKYPSVYDQQKLISEIREQIDPEEKVHTHVFQDVAKRQGLSRTTFLKEMYKKSKGLDFRRSVQPPKIKTKFNSFTLKQYGNGYKFIQKDEFITKIKLTNIGSIPVINPSRLPQGAKICTITIKKRASGFYAYCTYEIEDCKAIFKPRSEKKKPMFPYSNVEHNPDIREDIGIDRGVRNSIATSDGDIFTCSLLEQRAKELRKLNKEKDRKVKAHQLSGRKVESRRLTSLRRKIARHHEKTRRIRRDFFFKVASYLSSNYRNIFFEDLSLQKLIKKSTLDGWSRDYRRRLHSAALAGFLSILKQVSETTACKLHAVNPAWTSCICPYCYEGEIKNLSQQQHCCKQCGCVEDRDVAAAKVIKILGVNPKLLSVAKAKLLEMRQSLISANKAETPASSAQGR